MKQKNGGSEKKAVAVIVLGATGDLSKRKLYPALKALFRLGRISSDFLIMGTGRTPFSREQFLSHLGMEDSGFCDHLDYHAGLEGLKNHLDGLRRWDEYVCFLALPPEAYGKSAAHLHAEGFRDNCRLIIEKPFGSDVASSRQLNEVLHTYYREDQLYRMDHYLAKEAVQNILAFRFGNSLFEPLWNRESVESIQINAEETLGLEKRAAYFDKAGIIRDMVQNHLLQLLMITLMDPPRSLSPADLESAKAAALEYLSVEEAYLGQYEGYQNEPGIDSASETPTYAEIRFSLNNPRWEGVPLYLRTGKALGRRGTEIAVTFKEKPSLSGGFSSSRSSCPPNRIVFTIQPSPGIILDMMTKKPGEGMVLRSSRMNFCYSHDSQEILPDAYERLLLDALKGDKTLFVGGREIDLAWQKVDSLLDKSLGPGNYRYFPGHYPESPLGVPWLDFRKYAILCPLPGSLRASEMVQ